VAQSGFLSFQGWRSKESGDLSPRLGRHGLQLLAGEQQMHALHIRSSEELSSEQILVIALQSIDEIITDLVHELGILQQHFCAIAHVETTDLLSRAVQREICANLLARLLTITGPVLKRTEIDQLLKDLGFSALKLHLGSARVVAALFLSDDITIQSIPHRQLSFNFAAPEEQLKRKPPQSSSAAPSLPTMGVAP
jgi:hypothetical protein